MAEQLAIHPSEVESIRRLLREAESLAGYTPTYPTRGDVLLALQCIRLADIGFFLENIQVMMEQERQG